jgi:DNA-binding LacI/PurR family transcriptional regulator
LELAVRALHRSDGAEAMARLLDGGARFDAAFCFTDQLALGALRTATERGVPVPRDLALVGFDDIEDGRFSTPSLTTIAPDKAAIAEAALACLAERLHRPDATRPATMHHAAHRLLQRESTATT